MRTRTIIIVEEIEGSTPQIYCNDPDTVVVRVKQGDMESCRCCGCHHPPGFAGDCRDDDNRLVFVD